MVRPPDPYSLRNASWSLKEAGSAVSGAGSRPAQWLDLSSSLSSVQCPDAPACGAQSDRTATVQPHHWEGEVVDEPRYHAGKHNAGITRDIMQTQSRPKSGPDTREFPSTLILRHRPLRYGPH